MQIALQPCSVAVARRNFAKTIDAPVPRFDIVSHLRGNELALFDSAYSSEARLWGITPGVTGKKVEQWALLLPGDVVLFYRDNHFFRMARIEFTTKNAGLADSLWGKDDLGASYELLYFVTDVTELDLHIAKFNDIVSGSVGELVSHPIRSFDVLHGVQADRLAEALSLVVPVPPLAPPAGKAKPKTVTRTVTDHERDPAVREWVLYRADGICEGCEQAAPFLDATGTPFLEVHHMLQLSFGGSDRVSNAVALCPNCHRRLHHGIDAATFRDAIWARLSELVPEGAELGRLTTPSPT